MIFKLVVLVFLAGDLNASPDGIFTNKAELPTKEACMAYVSSERAKAEVQVIADTLPVEVRKTAKIGIMCKPIDGVEEKKAPESPWEETAPKSKGEKL